MTIKKTFLSTLAAFSAFIFIGGARLSHADDMTSDTEISNLPEEVTFADTSNPQTSSDTQIESSKKSHKKAFKLGVCVGQSLASDGIQLAIPAAGTKPNYDDATKSAFKKALKECKKALKKGSDTSEDESILSDEDFEDSILVE